MEKITLAAARVNAGFSLQEVADKLKKDRSTINNWEHGKVDIKAKDFIDLCHLYNISMDSINLSPTLQKVEKNEK